MKKNKLEEEEAEEEMDELHHENEVLHLKLGKLQKDNKEMKTKLESMSDDSEKLGGLKVRVYWSIVIHISYAPNVAHCVRHDTQIIFV